MAACEATFNHPNVIGFHLAPPYVRNFLLPHFHTKLEQLGCIPTTHHLSPIPYLNSVQFTVVFFYKGREVIDTHYINWKDIWEGNLPIDQWRKLFSDILSGYKLYFTDDDLLHY